MEVPEVGEQEGNLIAQSQVPDDSESLLIRANGIFEGTTSARQQAKKLQRHRLSPLISGRPETFEAAAGQCRGSFVLCCECREVPEKHGGYCRAPVVVERPEPGAARFQQRA